VIPPPDVLHHKRRDSHIVISNLLFGEWSSVFGDANVTTALNQRSRAMNLQLLGATARRGRRVLALASALCLALCQAGWAATPESPAAALDSSIPLLEEVIVTARRRVEKLSEVPLAESVLTGVELQQQSATRIEDALREAPNVLAFRSARSTSALEVTMRGQSALPSSIVYDPAVGLYIDGVYVANGQAAMGTLLDIDRVEIVRGAQGTLFGRNNTGGSISLYTNRPDMRGYSEEVALSAGSRNLFEGRLIENIPLGAGLAVRLAYQYNGHDGWGSSIVTGQHDLMNQRRQQLRLAALWQPNESFDAHFTYERFSANEAGALLHPLPDSIVAQLIPGDVVPADFYQTDTGRIQRDVALTEALQLTLTQQFSPNLQAKLIFGYRELHATNNYDADAMAAPIADVDLFSTSFQKSAELQFGGHNQHHDVDWVAGLYAFRDNGSADSNLAPDTLLSEVTGIPAVPTIETNKVVNRSVAAFVHNEWRVAGPWSLAAGARYTSDHRFLQDNAYWDLSPSQPAQYCTIVTDPVNAIPLGALTGGACPLIQREVAYHYWSWELVNRYRFSEQLMAYLRAGRAQRSGGWNVPFNSLLDAPFRPEELTDLELGLKASTLDGRLTLNAAAFTGRYTEMQRLLAQLVGGTPVTTVINAGRARVDGFELESAVKPSRAFAMHASFGWTDARYTQFIDPVTGTDESGNSFYMTPRFAWSVVGTYDIPVGSGTVRLRADYFWRDRVEFNVYQDPNFPAFQRPVGLLNTRASFTDRSQAWELALFATNLADRRYAYIGGSINAGISTPAMPVLPVASWEAAGDRRLIGVQATYRVASRH
jgi:iron complex outermembrane recepter protein